MDAPSRLYELVSFHETLATKCLSPVLSQSPPVQQDVDSLVQLCTKYQHELTFVLTTSLQFQGHNYHHPDNLDKLIPILLVPSNPDHDYHTQLNIILKEMFSKSHPDITSSSLTSLTSQESSILLDVIYKERRVLLQIIVDSITGASQLAIQLKKQAVSEEDWRIWFVQWVIDTFFSYSSSPDAIIQSILQNIERLSHHLSTIHENPPSIPSPICYITIRHISYERLLMFQLLHVLSRHVIIFSPKAFQTISSMLQIQTVCDQSYLLLLFTLVHAILAPIHSSTDSSSYCLLQIIKAQFNTSSQSLSSYKDIMEPIFAASWSFPKYRAVLMLTWSVYLDQESGMFWLQEAIQQDVLSWIRDDLLSSQSTVPLIITPMTIFPKHDSDIEQIDLFDEWGHLIRMDLALLFSRLHSSFTHFLKQLKTTAEESINNDNQSISMFECWLNILTRIFTPIWPEQHLVHVERLFTNDSSSFLEPFALSYWTHDTDIVTKDSYFLQWAGKTTHPRLVIAYLYMLSSLASPSPSCSLHCFRFLEQYYPDKMIQHMMNRSSYEPLSWTRLFKALKDYLNVLSDQQSINNAILSPIEGEMMQAYLTLLYRVMSNSQPVTNLFVDASEWNMIPLFFGLLSRYTAFTPTIQSLLWMNLATVAIHIPKLVTTLLNSLESCIMMESLVEIIEDVESKLEYYPYSISFLSFFHSMLERSQGSLPIPWIHAILDHGLVMWKKRSFQYEEERQGMLFILVKLLLLFLEQESDILNQIIESRLYSSSPIVDVLLDDVLAIMSESSGRGSSRQIVLTSIKILLILIERGSKVEEWFLMKQSTAFIGLIRATISSNEVGLTSLHMLKNLNTIWSLCAQDPVYMLLKSYPKDLDKLKTFFSTVLISKSNIINDVVNDPHLVIDDHFYRILGIKLNPYDISHFKWEILDFIQNSINNNSSLGWHLIEGTDENSIFNILTKQFSITPTMISVKTLELFSTIASKRPRLCLDAWIKHNMFKRMVQLMDHQLDTSLESWSLYCMMMAWMISITNKMLLLMHSDTSYNHHEQYLYDDWIQPQSGEQTCRIMKLLNQWMQYSPAGFIDSTDITIQSSLYPDLNLNHPSFILRDDTNTKDCQNYYNLDKISKYLNDQLSYLKVHGLFTTSTREHELTTEAHRIITMAYHSNQVKLHGFILEQGVDAWFKFVGLLAKISKEHSISCLERLLLEALDCCNEIIIDTPMSFGELHQSIIESILSAALYIARYMMNNHVEKTRIEFGEKQYQQLENSIRTKVFSALSSSDLSIKSREACYMMLLLTKGAAKDNLIHQLALDVVFPISNYSDRFQQIAICCLAALTRESLILVDQQQWLLDIRVDSASMRTWKYCLILGLYDRDDSKPPSSTIVDIINRSLPVSFNEMEDSVIPELLFLVGLVARADMRIMISIAKWICASRDSLMHLIEDQLIVLDDAYSEEICVNIVCTLFLLGRIMDALVWNKLDHQDRVTLSLFKRTMMIIGCRLVEWTEKVKYKKTGNMNKLLSCFLTLYCNWMESGCDDPGLFLTHWNMERQKSDISCFDAFSVFMEYCIQHLKELISIKDTENTSNSIHIVILSVEVLIWLIYRHMELYRSIVTGIDKTRADGNILSHQSIASVPMLSSWDIKRQELRELFLPKLTWLENNKSTSTYLFNHGVDALILSIKEMLNAPRT